MEKREGLRVGKGGRVRVMVGKMGRTKGGKRGQGLKVGKMGGYGWGKGGKSKGGIIGKEGKEVRVEGCGKG